MQGVRNVLRRKNGVISGVAGGIADFFGLDVSMVRFVLVASAILGGSGFLLYIGLWLMIPKEGWVCETDVAPAVVVPAAAAA